MVSIDSIGSLRRSLSALKVTIQIGKVGESIWQYSQFVSRRAQCYQAYIYIYTRYKSKGALGSLPAAYRFLFQLSFLPTFPIVRRKYRIENWFLTRSPSWIELYYPQPLLFTKRMEGWHFTREPTVHIYICFLVLLLLLLRSLFTAQRRRSIALLPSLRWENVKIVSINVSMKQGGIEEKVGTDVWIIRIEIRSFEFTVRWRSVWIDRFDKI